MEERNTKYMRELTVSKGNPLIQKSKYDLTPQQYDLLTYCVSLVKPTDKQGTVYNFEIQDFCRVVGIQDRNGKNYKNVKQALDAIDTMKIWVYDKNTQTQTRTRWFNILKIHEGDGTISFSFHESVGDWVYLQASNFTSYIAENIYSLGNCKYAKYLFDFCHSYMEQGNITVAVEEIAEICPHPYKDYFKIKEKVLTPSIEEINSKTDITVSYIPIRQGRKTTHIKFSIRKAAEGVALMRKQKRKEALDGNKDMPY